MRDRISLGPLFAQSHHDLRPRLRLTYGQVKPRLVVILLRKILCFRKKLCFSAGQLDLLGKMSDLYLPSNLSPRPVREYVNFIGCGIYFLSPQKFIMSCPRVYYILLRVPISLCSRNYSLFCSGSSSFNKLGDWNPMWTCSGVCLLGEFIIPAWEPIVPTREVYYQGSGIYRINLLGGLILSSSRIRRQLNLSPQRHKTLSFKASHHPEPSSEMKKFKRKPSPAEIKALAPTL
ncbi:hypothetical protein F511_03513 [Dorcoceras hygrometricum]|uniref:Uncharacterized protein n=1 Tax=Dorcoceras hygrometricum TaxID=472368 RepID=A0A2Z7AHP5_9LAMI|nr:hypothetical protein F511_03513 [Dorcoceras hygrometricum]